MTIKMLPYVRQVVTGTAESHSLTLLKMRDLVDVSDEPEERGGFSVVADLCHVAVALSRYNARTRQSVKTSTTKRQRENATTRRY